MTSASLTMPVEKGLIKKVAAGDERIGRLFTEEQLIFLLAMAHRKLDYSKLVALVRSRPSAGSSRSRPCPGR